MIIVKNQVLGNVKFVGAITLWYGVAADIPSGWSIYEPAENVFVMGGDTVDTTPSESATHDHTNPDTTPAPNHGHSGSITSTGSSSDTYENGVAGGGSSIAHPHNHGTSGSISANAGGGHSHECEDTDEETVYPPYKRLYWVKQESKSQVPEGCIVMWSGALSTVPEDWEMCDGTNNTIDLRGYFVRGASQDSEVDTTGGSTSHDHENTDKVSLVADHQHSLSGSISGSVSSSPYGFTAGSKAVANGTHSHSLGGTSGDGGEHDHSLLDTLTAEHLPPFYYLYFIQAVN